MSHDVTTAPIDWPQVFEDLAYLGLTGKELARAAHVDTSAVKRWAGGVSPAGRNADHVVTVWCHMTGKSVEFLPRLAAGARAVPKAVANLDSDEDQEPALCQSEALQMVWGRISRTK